MSIAETLEKEGQMTEQQASMHLEEPERALDGEQRENRDEQAPESPQGQAQQERPHEAARKAGAQAGAQPGAQPGPQAANQDGARGGCAAPDPATQSKAELGRRGEDAAVRYLVNNGFEILERNWTCPYGEADIIARDTDGTVCFIEVKTRLSVAAGFPEEAITAEKQQRYERIALSYMMGYQWDDGTSVRFDAIGLCVKEGGTRAMLRHHRGCFNDFR